MRKLRSSSRFISGVRVAAILFALNFFADKIPYIDSINDVLQTFVRIPAGALLAYGATGGLSPEVSIIAGLLGGTLAAGTHIAKTGSRALINTSPEPFSNVFAHPITFLCLLALFVILLIWLLPKLVRLALVPFRRLARGRREP